MLGQNNHLPKGKHMLSAFVLSAILFSCSKEGLQEDVAQTEGATTEPFIEASVPTATTYASSIIWKENFEGSTFFSGAKLQSSTTYAFAATTAHAIEGSKSGRFELRDTDPIASNGTRSEILLPEQTNQHRWYAFSVYFPSAEYARDSYEELITQWHQGSGTPPPAAIQIKNDRYQLLLNKTATNSSSNQTIDLGAVGKDRWNRFVFHFKHSNSSDGVLEIWLNGSKIYTRNGPVAASMTVHEKPRWKVGIYKWKWNGDLTTDTKKRVLFYDDIRIGNENATYADLAGAVTSGSTSGSTGSTGTNTPTTSTSTQKVVSFTLVNSATEKDVMTITNGAVIDMSALGLTKINIRANTNPSTVGSVKLELSGSQSKTYTDNKFPYALHSDDGNGNYYYGNWYNAGAYGTFTLKATPYANSNASGTAGTTSTISFTIKQ